MTTTDRSLAVNLPSIHAGPAETSFLAGGGQTGAVIRAIDWAATPLGPVCDWPQSLRTSLSICSSSRFPIALCWGPEFVMLYNDDLLPMLGADRHPRAMGRPAFEALPEIRDTLERVVETGEAIRSEHVRIPLRRGEARDDGYFTFTCSPIRDESGGIGGVFCAVLETTDKIIENRARDQLQRDHLYALFMQTPAPICIFEGPEHRFAFANQPYLTMVGRSDVVGKTLVELYPERTTTLRRFDHAYATGETFRGEDVRFRFERRPGVIEDGWFNVVYEPFRGPDGRVAGILVVSLDVTDAVHAREASELARKEAEAAAAAQRAVLEFQERFVAVLGHDLRNPLAAIDMAAGLLRQQAEQQRNSTALRILGRIKSSSLRMSRMVEQILDLSRSRIGGGLTVRPAVMDLGAMLGAVVDELRTANPTRAIELRCGSIVGSWDRDRLEQVFSNLIGNAIHHGLAETPITVTAREVDAGVEIEVHNEGPPIPEALRTMLFDPFRRGDRDSRTAKTAGLGLGLYISRALAVAHGGTIAVRSADNEGTTFRVTLPRAIR